MRLVVGVAVVPDPAQGVRQALRGCTHKTRLPCDSHNACFKCRLKEWGLEGLCTPTRRCTECTNQPAYVYAEIVNKIEQGRKRSLQRAKARDKARANLALQIEAEKKWAAERRANQLDVVPLGGPAGGPQADLFPDPPAQPQPSATSTPVHALDDESFHASDFLSPPGVDNDITFVFIDEVMNITDIIDALTPSGTHSSG